MRILVITPAKNESAYIAGLIDSMLNQRLRPTKWIIVDDGSTDGMTEIVQQAAEANDFIELVQKNNHGEERTGGSKVVRAFNTGYEKFKHIEHDVVVKLDGDLTLPTDYFECIVQAFNENPELGLCGGYCVVPDGSDWIREANAPHHVRGALKAYRKDCFDSIGGLTETWNWDGIDTMQIMHAGWHIRVIEKEVKHHRPTSAAYDPISHAFKSGREAYRTGNDLGITLIRSILKLKSGPAPQCTLKYLQGYLKAAISREPKVVDRELQTFIRRFAYKRVLKLQ
jgi:glycosyltransferase involved in cell wall biosynthesis